MALAVVAHRQQPRHPRRVPHRPQPRLPQVVHLVPHAVDPVGVNQHRRLRRAQRPVEIDEAVWEGVGWQQRPAQRCGGGKLAVEHVLLVGRRASGRQPAPHPIEQPDGARGCSAEEDPAVGVRPACPWWQAQPAGDETRVGLSRGDAVARVALDHQVQLCHRRPPPRQPGQRVAQQHHVQVQDEEAEAGAQHLEQRQVARAVDGEEGGGAEGVGPSVREAHQPGRVHGRQPALARHGKAGRVQRHQYQPAHRRPLSVRDEVGAQWRVLHPGDKGHDGRPVGAGRSPECRHVQPGRRVGRRAARSSRAGKE
mmetsp:Transcript_31277/g.101015  ORF Transcript_31277/g.101015 Transcript_31277/m.101015 type:complete len:310 (-) Transcript_31277:942-1871(-)